jgi:hypothetical protein
MFGPTFHNVVKGFNNTPCLQIKTPTGRRAQRNGRLVYSITRVYVGNVDQGSIGKAAHTLGFKDLILGKFIESIDEKGCKYFEMELKYPGEFAFVIESNDLRDPDGKLFVGTQCTSPSKNRKPALIYPLDGKPHVKVAEVLTSAEKCAGMKAKHYKCTAVFSKEGQAPEMQRKMDELEIKGVEDLDLMEITTAVWTQKTVYRSQQATARGAGGDTRSFRGGSEKHALFIGESEQTAVQHTCSIDAQPLSSDSTIQVRMYARRPEAPEARFVSECKVGVAPRILEKPTSEYVLKTLEAKMLEFAKNQQYSDALKLQTEINEKKRKNDEILKHARPCKQSYPNSLPDEGCASQQRNYMPEPMLLLSERNVDPVHQIDPNEVHDFEGTCDWEIQITVKEHDGKDDDVGVRVDNSKVMTEGNYRRYQVKHGQLIKVTLKNLSQKNKIHLRPVYKEEKEANEEPEDLIDIEAGFEEYELPYPLEKKEGEEEDFWLLKNNLGRTLLTLGFVVQ